MTAQKTTFLVSILLLRTGWGLVFSALNFERVAKEGMFLCKAKQNMRKLLLLRPC